MNQKKNLKKNKLKMKEKEQDKLLQPIKKISDFQNQLIVAELMVELVLVRPTWIWPALNFPETAGKKPFYCCTIIGPVINGNNSQIA